MIYLNITEWTEKYISLNKIVSSEFFKLETLPSYNDYGIYDWDKISNIDMLKLIVKAQNSIQEGADAIREQINNGVNITRVRFFTFPLSKYILRQFSVYKIYEDLGVNIQIFEEPNYRELFDLNYFRDFLLFDNKYLLLIDNPNGCFNGGFYSEDQEEISNFIKIKKTLENKTIALKTYLTNFNIVNPVLIDN